MAARRVVIRARTLHSNRVETNGNKPKTVKTGKDSENPTSGGAPFDVNCSAVQTILRDISVTALLYAHSALSHHAHSEVHHREITDSESIVQL